MSRSYKLPIVKDGGHKIKKSHARRYRSRCKQITRICIKHYDVVEFSTDDPMYPHRKAITNQYDICDWKIMYRVRRWSDGFEWFGDIYSISPEDIKRAKRK